MVTSLSGAVTEVPVAVSLLCGTLRRLEEFAGVIATDTRVPVPTVTVVEPVTPDEAAERVSVPAFLACKIARAAHIGELGFRGGARKTLRQSGSAAVAIHAGSGEQERRMFFNPRVRGCEIVIDTSLTVENCEAWWSAKPWPEVAVMGCAAGDEAVDGTDGW